MPKQKSLWIWHVIFTKKVIYALQRETITLSSWWSGLGTAWDEISIQIWRFNIFADHGVVRNSLNKRFVNLIVPTLQNLIEITPISNHFNDRQTLEKYLKDFTIMGRRLHKKTPPK